METENIARTGYIGLTGLYTLLVLCRFSKTQSLKLPFLGATRGWGGVVLCLIPLLLIATSLWALQSQLHLRSGLGLHLDDYTHFAALAGAFASLLAALSNFSSILQLIYDASSCLSWTLAYPLVHTGPPAVAVVIPILYLLHGAALLAGAGENAYLDRSTGVHPLTGHISFLSRVTLSWLSPLLEQSMSGTLDVGDIWELDEQQNVRRFLGEAENESSLHSVQPKKPLPTNILRLLLRDYTPLMLGSVSLEIGYLFLAIAQPFLVRALIEQRSPSIVVSLFVSGIFLGIFYYHALMLVRLVGMRLRSALTARVCEKGMLAAGSIGTSGVEPSVLSEVDLVNIFRMVEVVNELWVVPVHTMLSLSALAYILGWQSVLAGLTAALLIVPLLILVVNIMAGRLALLMAAKDQRVSLVREVLAGVKHVKLYGWQAIFERKIDEMRALELKALGRVAFSNLSSNALSSLIPTIMVSVSFGAHIILTGSLTSSVIFPSLILFNGVSRWMEQLPRTAMTWKTGVVSYQRVQEFLTTNFHDQSLGPSSMHEANDLAEVFMMGLAINVPEAEGRAGPDKTLLRDVDFHAVLGNLTIITGPVGSGKTTLLRTIVGEIQPGGGMAQASGRLAYSSQRPFLINGSIRENILFGLPFDALWYQKVLDSVCLSPDLALLPDGDTTMLGGMGAALSGGQQSRVVLARAVYSRRPLVVLDDPLAAMDPSVQRQLVKNVLGTNGILKDCTRIVVTSNQALIQQASAIYAIENGTLEMLPASLTEAGYEEVAFESTATVVTELEHVGLDLPSYGTLKSSTIPLVKTRSIEEPERDIESTPLLKSTQSKDGGSFTTGGGVAFSTYLTYLSCAKLWGWPLVLGLAASCTLLEIRSVYYLQEVGEEFETTGHSAKLYFYILCRVIGSAFIGIFVLAGYFGCLIPTSRELHDKLTRGVLESQFSFFDATPMGAIISRFTTDISRMDGPACSGFISLCSIGTSVLCSVLVVVSTSVSSVLYMVPLAMLYVYIQKFYLSAYRQLRRLDNKTRGPILNVANEMRVGYSVILAYQQAEFFSERARDLINEHLRVWAPFLCLDIWLQLRLYALACVVQSLTATLLLVVGAPSSTLGLVMSFVLQITNLLGFLVQTSANLEADLTSLERISEYMGNTPEADTSDDLAPPPSWPSRPSVAVENFSAAYRRGGLLCLRDVNFCIPAGQRVAVVGRTGAGKSSLVLALMRAIDQAAVRPGSRILIDGVDIMTEVPLDKLRKKITVIPQEPVVFSGSIRDNLDPDGGRSEEELRNAVAASRLVEVLGLVPGDDPLDFKVTNAGRGLSTGQIQLLAITRAIVAKPALIIVDEATSAIDSKMATLITDVMRQAFKGITTITVAHQIWSVIDYDWILVLDRGSAIEFASPETLLKNPDSQFSRLVRDAGIETRLAENDPLEKDLS